MASTPPIYMAFDCLCLEGRDLRSLALRERRGELEQVVENDHALIFPARRLDPNGLVAWRQVLERGYEGLVANSWLKVRQRDYRVAERGLVAIKRARDRDAEATVPRPAPA